MLFNDLEIIWDWSKRYCTSTRVRDKYTPYYDCTSTGVWDRYTFCCDCTSTGVWDRYTLCCDCYTSTGVGMDIPLAATVIPVGAFAPYLRWNGIIVI